MPCYADVTSVHDLFLSLGAWRIANCVAFPRTPHRPWKAKRQRVRERYIYAIVANLPLPPQTLWTLPSFLTLPSRSRLQQSVQFAAVSSVPYLAHVLSSPCAESRVPESVCNKSHICTTKRKKISVD